MASVPVHKWYYLGGYFSDGAGGKTTDPQYPLAFPASAWEQYDTKTSSLLSESYEALLTQGSAGNGKLLDLATCSDPPLEYEVWKGCEVTVSNPRAPEQLRGEVTIGGLAAKFWKHITDEPALLPEPVSKWVQKGVAAVKGGFYQIHHDSVKALEDLELFLADGERETLPDATLRRRIVMLVEFPVGWRDPGPTPVRKWFYLGGYFNNSEGQKTTDPQFPLNFPASEWIQYNEETTSLLNDAYEYLLCSQGAAAPGRLCDLASSKPPLEYEIWKGRAVTVVNPRAPSHLQGQTLVGGFPTKFWTEVESTKKLLPSYLAQWVDMGICKLEGGFYQVHHDSLEPLEKLLNFFADKDQESPPTDYIRKRVMLLAEFPHGWMDKVPPPPAPIGLSVLNISGTKEQYVWAVLDRTIGDLRAEIETDFQMQLSMLLHDTTPLNDTDTVAAAGLQDGATLTAVAYVPPQPPGDN